MTIFHILCLVLIFVCCCCICWIQMTETGSWQKKKTVFLTWRWFDCQQYFWPTKYQLKKNDKISTEARLEWWWKTADTIRQWHSCVLLNFVSDLLFVQSGVPCTKMTINICSVGIGLINICLIMNIARLILLPTWRATQVCMFVSVCERESEWGKRRWEDDLNNYTCSTKQISPTEFCLIVRNSI